MTTKNEEVITVEAEEVPIEQAVEKSFLTQIEKHEITKKHLKEINDECLAIKVTDKESFILASEKRKNVKVQRVAIEKVCKKGREDAVKEQKAWIALEKEYVNIITPGEEYLKKQENDWEEAEEKAKAEIKRQQEEAFILRQSELTKLGATYQDGSFVLNDVSYEAVLIKESDDEVWTTIRQRYLDQYTINEAARLAEEEKKKEAEALLQKQREEQELRQRQLEAREAEIKRKEDEELARKMDEERKATEEGQRKQKEKIQSRCHQLTALGLTFDFKYDAFLFEDVNVDNKTEICLLEDDKWSALIEKITPIIEQRKKEAHERSLAIIEEEKKKAADEAVKKEQERVAAQKLKDEADKKLADEKKQRELEAADDKTKWAAWLEEFNKVPPIPAMKSPNYRTKASIAREKIEEIKNG